ncbi:hypothetical protein [Pedobacter africanus]|uniref:Uncharacterized protein n=1 Tax=Pedobacter africanus TaxID=151894 RepID=A0ACC6KRX5_9SPHI|nr:hypothetical protein [Pedobacter africanus]MDR6781905.1 hypothetical protein [Pedobacter africanus]
MRVIQFSEYKKHVILAYRRLRDNGDLPAHLKRPTPAGLKKECLFVLADKNRYSEKDIDILRSFFGPKNDLNEYSLAIKKFGADKCKPLSNFLKKLEGNTDDKNIELLALIINFKPRPFIYGVTAIDDDTSHAGNIKLGNEHDESEPKIGIRPVDQQDAPQIGDHKKAKRNLIPRKLATSITTLTLVLVIGGTYFYQGQNRAYICDRGTGKKYHLSNKCPSLKKCNNSFVSTTIAEAEKNGKTLCDWEK